MPRFVVQHHQATSLHFDFRLEVAGVFKSWAVPKGPSTDPRDKRLAMAVPDHSIASGYREGDQVIVWDRGSYENLRAEPMEEALATGHASFWLDGEKLQGGWSLRHIEDRRWLLVKHRDERADAGDPVAERPESVVSGRTVTGRRTDARKR
jgi:DNA ligase D-like protein (predicted 3'-phosphoesterase)